MINFSDFSLRRGTKLLFHDVTLTLHKQQKVGVTGANGCGKSSLFAVMRDELHADSGDLLMPPNLTIAHVLQETPALEQSAVDYVMQGDEEWEAIQSAISVAEQQHNHERLGQLYAKLEAIDGYSAPTRAAKLLSGLGFPVEDMQRPVKEFSGGWRMRLNLGRALMCRSDLLLLDEPTNHLDLDTVFWLEEWLKSYPGTLMLISHDRDFLDSICTHILHVENQHIDLYSGNYSFFEKARHEKRVLQQSSFVKQQGEVKQLQQFIDRFRAKATKAKQVQSRIKSLEKMQQISAVHERSLFKFQFKEVARMPNPVMQLDKVQLGYPRKGYSDNTILEKIEFNLYPGARIGLLGHNGAGKSTFIKFLAGDLKPLQGDLTIPDDLKIGYFAQHQLEQLNHQDTPLEFIQRFDKTASEQTIRDFLGGFGFARAMAESKIEPFSGGEKSRLVLASIVYQAPSLLLMDEPTNHLDLEMRDALSFALQKYQGAMVVVSHDRHLLNSITDEFYLVGEGKVELFDGDLNDYRDYLAQQLSLQKAVQKQDKNIDEDKLGSSQNRKEQRKQAAEKRQQLQPLTKKLKQLENKLEKLSEEKEQLEHKLAQADIYADQNKSQLKDLLGQQLDNTRMLEDVEEQWMDVSEELELLS